MNNVIRYRLKGVDCAGCAGKVETALGRLDGVAEASVSVATRVLTLSLEQGSRIAAEVPQLLERLGYGAVLLPPLQQTAARGEASGAPIGFERSERHGQGHADGHAHADEGERCGNGENCGDGGHAHHGACKDEHSAHGGDGCGDGRTAHESGHAHHSHGGDKPPGGCGTDRHNHQGHDSHSGHGGGGDDHGHDHSHAFEADLPWWRQRSARLVFASGAAMAVAWLVGWLYAPADRWAFALAMLVGLVPIARRAYAAARAGVPFSIEMLMSVAAVGAVVIGSAEEAAMVVLLFLVGELLEGVTAERARASIGKLAELVPKRAFARQSDGSFSEVAASALKVGDVIRVRPGDRIAADGEVTEGVGSVNEAPVTGESVPREKAPGDAVFAGTVNGESALLVSVTAAAADNTIARVIRLVEEAQSAKAPMARFIDRFARRYTPAIALLALLTACVPPLLGASWGEWIYKALALLLIGCPCALVISTPTALAAGLARGARHGLLMKGGAVLENAGRLGVIAFDKTGTLTAGTPQVTDVVVAEAGSEAAVLSVAAALEAGSSHPLALAVLAKAQAAGAPVLLAQELGAIAGAGVAGSVEGRRYFLGSARAAAARATTDGAIAARIDELAQQGKTIAVLVEEGPLVEATVQAEQAVPVAEGGEAAAAAAPAFADAPRAQTTGSGRVIGVLAMRDELRADALAGIRRLRAQGVRCVMLTGDTARTARAIAAELDIEVRAELLPQDKQRIVAELKAEANAQGRFAGVVGDGINDAPALAVADVGIAMGGGTDVALETADAAILRGKVSDVGAMLNLSRATMRNIYQNIGFALGFKAIFLVTTLLGITGLWPAILADTGATVIVTLNAMRLLRWRD